MKMQQLKALQMHQGFLNYLEHMKVYKVRVQSQTCWQWWVLASEGCEEGLGRVGFHLL